MATGENRRVDTNSTTHPSHVSFHGYSCCPFRNPNQALWEKGDFTRLAATMRGSGDALVEKIGVKAGLRVLDLGCGDGTTAVPEAQRGAEVLGVDIARNLVDAGNRRAQQFGLAKLKFQQGDACDLQGVPDKISISSSRFSGRCSRRGRWTWRRRWCA